MCARKGAILSGETPFAQRDGPPHQLKLVEGGADGRHCISYQDNPVGSFSSKCSQHGNWIDVNPVDDDACRQTLLGKGCSDDAGPAAGKRRHGVKEMRYAGEAVGTGLHHGLRSRFAVADRNANADPRQPPQKTIRQSFGCKRNQRAASAGKIGQPVEVGQTRSADMVQPVDAGSCGANEGTFQMQAEHSVTTGSLARRRYRGLCLLPRIRDQRR